jgi:acetamidase/formamidase
MTFGGAAPKQRISPGTRIVTWTEDCFDGAVKTAADLPRRVPPGHDNPQTGPFHIEGSEPGTRSRIHPEARASVPSPCRRSAWASVRLASGTDRTAMLGPDFPKRPGDDLDAGRQVARTSTRDGKHSWEAARPFLGCLGVAPAMSEVRSTIVPAPFGGNMDCWRCAPETPCFSA